MGRYIDHPNSRHLRARQIEGLALSRLPSAPIAKPQSTGFSLRPYCMPQLWSGNERALNYLRVTVG